MTELALIGLAVLTWLWLDGMQARERVLRQVRRVCEDSGLLLLDQSVVLMSMRLARQPSGRIGIRRGYRFEFSREGDRRFDGHAWLNGAQIESIHLALPEGTVHTTGHGRVIEGRFGTHGGPDGP
ncbi:MAG TPA: DUF3301 domain-containing protein [Gammaproteobacteria bacterium]|nr:DUF3301 domain-containing protein [Gammaproteobacteria bacterium]